MPAGSVTKNTANLIIGEGELRVGASATNIGNSGEVLTSSDGLGAMKNIVFNDEATWVDHESGYPAIDDISRRVGTKANITGNLEELSRKNLALAKGLDWTSYAALSGEIPIGQASTTPFYVRTELLFTLADNAQAVIIFPRALFTNNIALNFANDSWSGVPVTIKAFRADSKITDGHGSWDLYPLGRFMYRKVA